MHRLPFTALLLALSLSPATAQQQGEAGSPRRGSIITVKGTGQFEQKPDYGRFEAVVTTRGKTLDEAAAAHEARATKALEMLRSLEGDGVTIEKSAFQVSEERPAYQPPVMRGDPPPVPPKPPENPFSASTTFNMKATRIDRLNAAVSRIAGSGLFALRQVTFKADRERAALNQARRAAMVDAREQATAYAEAGDLALVEIIEVTDGEARPYEDGAFDLPRSRFVQIIPPAAISFEASVNVTWRIAPRQKAP